MADGNDYAPPEDGALESREPSVEDLVNLCRILNELEAEYIIIGGFAIRAAGYDRRTMDVDLLINTIPENEAKVYRALESLPDKAVLQLEPGEVARYQVVRIADEIVVDLMHAACGIEYLEASKDVVVHEIDGIKIPFASPVLLWKTKAKTHREKDAADLAFLRQLFAARGETPPES
jgi:hypothetical protein